MRTVRMVDSMRKSVRTAMVVTWRKAAIPLAAQHSTTQHSQQERGGSVLLLGASVSWGEGVQQGEGCEQAGHEDLRSGQENYKRMNRASGERPDRCGGVAVERRKSTNKG